MVSGKKPKDKEKDEVPVAPDPFPNMPPSQPTIQPSSMPLTEPILELTFETVRYPEPPDKIHFDEIDVPFALARVTQDGRGEREPGPSDFTGYASPDAVREAGT